MGLITSLRRLQLNNKHFTLFANNCISGFIYQRYGLKYETPTIGVGFMPLEFVKFCNNYEYYLSQELVQTDDFNHDWFKPTGGGEVNFPVGRLDDICLYFQHSKDFEKSKADWEKRKKRINKDNVFMVLYDHESNLENFEAFETIKSENKIYLYHKGEIINSKDAFFIKDFNDPTRGWWSRMNKRNPFSKRYFEQFDWTKWLNREYK